VSDPTTARDKVFRHRPDVALIDRIKIQSEVLGPLIKELERTLGTRAAHEVVRSGIGEFYRNMVQELVGERGSLGALAALGEISSDGSAIEGEIRERSERAFEFDIVGCRYAEFYREIGEPDIGFLLVCSSDYAMVEGMPGVELQRTHTVMQGDDFCDFRYRFLADELAPPP
jgi:hypothetical protein